MATRPRGTPSTSPDPAMAKRPSTGAPKSLSKTQPKSFSSIPSSTGAGSGSAADRPSVLGQGAVGVALRKPQPAVVESQVRVADILAELGGVDPGRRFDGEAEAVASRLRLSMLSRDWSGRPTVGCVDAERLLWQWRRDRAVHDEDMAAQVARFEDEFARRLPPGVVGVVAPGLEWYADGVDQRVLNAPLVTERPGG